MGSDGCFFKNSFRTDGDYIFASRGHIGAVQETARGVARAQQLKSMSGQQSEYIRE